VGESEEEKEAEEWGTRARLPAHRCGVDGCEYQTKNKRHLKVHQARMHGIGDVDVEELRRKKREWDARQPAQRCGVDGCEFQTKIKQDLKKHQARKHGIGDVDAEELRRKKREYAARQPAQRCGVDGCEFQTKQKRDLKMHQAAVHGIGDVEKAEELRRKNRERMQACRARQAAQRSGVNGGESEESESDISESEAPRTLALLRHARMRLPRAHERGARGAHRERARLHGHLDTNAVAIT
jgi:hypothetical protein